MANGLSLKVLLQLQKKQFVSGLKSVQQQLSGFARAVKNVAGMLIGGIGFSQLTSHLKDTAKELSMFKATLENVSNGYKEYIQNLEFLDRISNRYGQDVIALGTAFARFRAAAKTSNLSLDQQRDIFEALTRAAGAYHLSAEQTQMAMLAVEQMLNKGVVAAEELRRQLGQYIPGAFNLMARAAGMAGITLNGTTKELQDAMKAGKVIAEDVLPHFAQVLRTVTASANFDSLVSSSNRLNNAWTKFVNNSEFTKFFKKIVDFGTSSLNYVGESAQKVFRILITGLSTIASFGITRKIGGWVKQLKEIGLNSLPPIKKEFQSVGEEVKVLETELKAVDKELKKVQKGKGNGWVDITSTKDIDALKQTVSISKSEEKVLKNIVKTGQKASYNIGTENQMLNKQLYLENKRTAILSDVQRKSDTINNKYGQTLKTVRATGTVWNGIKTVVSQVWTTVKGVAISMGAAFAVSLVTNFITRMVQLNREIKAYKNLLKTSKDDIEKAGAETERDISWAEKQYEIAKDTNYELERRVAAANEFKKALNDTTTPIEDILNGTDNVNKKLEAWSKNIRKAAKEAALFNKITELEEKRLELEQKIRNEKAKPVGYKPVTGGIAGLAISAGVNELFGRKDELAISLYEQELIDVENAIKGLFEIANNEGLTNPFTGDGMSGGVDAVKAIKTALDEYKKTADELKVSLDKGKISHSKYNRVLNKLRDNTLNTIKAFENYEDVIEGLDEGYQKLFKELDIASTLKKTKSDLETVKEALDEYEKKANEVSNQFKANALTAEEYAKEHGELADKAFKSISAFENLDTILSKLGSTYVSIANNVREAFQEMQMMNAIEKQMEEQDKVLEKEMDNLIDKIVKYNEKSAEIIAKGIPQRKEIEGGRFVYKDGFGDGLREYANNAKNYVKELEKYKTSIENLRKYGELDPFMQKELEKVIELLKKARVEAKSLVDAADFAEVSEDIKKLKEDLSESKWDVWSRGVLGASETIWSATKKLMEAFGGDEWEELFGKEVVETFDKLFTVLGALSDVVKTLSESFELYNNVVKISTKLTQAQEAQTAILKGTQQAQSAAQVAAQIQQTAAETASAGATVSAEATKQVAINSTTNALANQAVAGAASSQASIPVVGPVLAAGAVMAIIALLATHLGKFAKGGIVNYGSSSGDKTLARVNKGEGILTAEGVKNLNTLYNNRNSAGGQVEFVLRGDRLYGAIQNYKSKMRG